jgi:hypothetical protein
MPTGRYVRRKEPDYKPEMHDRYYASYDWLDYMACLDGVKIQHRMNSGEEKSIDGFYVDGWADETQVWILTLKNTLAL